MRDNAKKVKPVNLGNDQHELSFKMEQGGKETCDKKIQTQLIKAPQCLESVDSESDNEE